MKPCIYKRMNLATAKNKTDDKAIWIISSAFICSLPEPELFKIIVVNTILKNIAPQQPFWKLILTSVWQVISVLLWVILILVIFSSIGRQLAFAGTSISVITPKAVEVDNFYLLRQIKKQNSRNRS